MATRVSRKAIRDTNKWKQMALYYSSCWHMIEDNVNGIILEIPIPMVSSSTMRMFMKMVNKGVTVRYSRPSWVSSHQMLNIICTFCAPFLWNYCANQRKVREITTCVVKFQLCKTNQGGHGTGKTGNLVLTFSRQGKHREFCCNTGKIFETQGKYFWLYSLMQKACFSSHIIKIFWPRFAQHYF